MKQLISFLRRIKARYYICASIIITTVCMTPGAIEAAYENRGYRAVGGEYLLVPLGFILAWILCRTMQSFDEYKSKAKQRRRNVHVRNKKAFSPYLGRPGL